jgi:hypothetical protein
MYSFIGIVIFKERCSEDRLTPISFLFSSSKCVNGMDPQSDSFVRHFTQEKFTLRKGITYSLRQKSLCHFGIFTYKPEGM